jgi:hypothetical protein
MFDHGCLGLLKTWSIVKRRHVKIVIYTLVYISFYTSSRIRLFIRIFQEGTGLKQMDGLLPNVMSDADVMIPHGSWPVHR